MNLKVLKIFTSLKNLIITRKLTIAIALTFLAFTNPSLDDHIRAYCFEYGLDYPKKEGKIYGRYWKDVRRMRRMNFLFFSIGQVDYRETNRQFNDTIGVAGFVFFI